MIPLGYLAKRISKLPDALKLPERVVDVYSVSDCVNDDFAEYIDYWKHNGFWLFDSPEVIRAVAQEHTIDFHQTALFYYEAYKLEFDGENWQSFGPEPSIPTNIMPPSEKTLEGFDVVTFWARGRPEHSPLSCNGLAKDLHTNAHCLFDTFDEAKLALDGGSFKNCEPGPYRIFAVYSIDRP